jgi:hypothetical protein
MTIAERLGVPVAVLAVLCFFLFKALSWIGNKVVLPIKDSHIALVEQTQKATEANSATLSKMTDILKVQSVNVDEIRRDVTTIHGKLDNALKVKQ